MHAGQQRADGSPLILHPFEVARLLEGVGAPDHLVAAGILHDVIEKTQASASELHKRFGGRIATLVVAVSDDERIAGYGRRKAALRRQVAAAGEEALTLFAADKLSKLRELRRERERGPDGVPSLRRERRGRRVRHYQRSLALLEERLSSSRLVEQLREELDAYLHSFQRPRADADGPATSERRRGAARRASRRSRPIRDPRP
jgi:(p)ppGpp synthase/HD superfamily hydrolase